MLTICIFIENDLYTNRKRSIYKLKMIYIQIENDLYINHSTTS
ncbi:hypothetical protein HMPREF1553_00032 [Porphyromonas gingivalis F0568]|nr:hypothetical protein HMPREF1553_00032 [Porphyromonas gingivalis F0568]